MHVCGGSVGVCVRACVCTWVEKSGLEHLISLPELYCYQRQIGIV